MKDIEEVEKVQKRATKQVKSLRGLPYEQRLRKLNLPTLRYRRHIVETWLKFTRFYMESLIKISQMEFFIWHKTAEEEDILWN